ncbi:copper amine oxidase N-terminal domain-containing protein [Firmicutes bacterium AM55-24TS]|nr:copper amine oxidase N-terminal domain-containing protein [Firmicutes bacterium AM55-24TS]RHP11279.1 copper amine oxidase N-terminal domain-containing protein [Firmicutes bacterium AF36-3BH]
MKKIIPIILLLTAVMSTSTALADENITVMLNGQAMDFDVAPIIQNDRVLVPMRAIFEELHCSVDYTDIDGRQIITAKLNENNSIGLVIGSDEMQIHNQKIKLDTAPIIVNDRTLVPLRAVSEAFDYDVNWDEDTKTVTISKEIPKTEYDILYGRLKVKIKSDSKVYDGFWGDDTWLELSNEGIDFVAKELGYITVGDLKKDAENLEYETVGDTVTQNGIEYIELKSEKENRVEYLVKSSDDYLILLYAKANAKTDKDLWKTNAQEIIDTLSAGDKKLDTSANSVHSDYLTIARPNGYFVRLDGDDRYGWIIKKVTKTDEKGVPLLYIDEMQSDVDEQTDLYNGNKAYKKVKSKFLGNDLEWLLYNEDNYMQTYVEYDQVSYHIYAYAESTEKQQDVINFVSGIKENCAGVGIGGKPVIYLYPEKEQEVNVKLDLDGKFTFTYPEYNNGWNVTAKPDGTIISDGKEYSYLFWEGLMPTFKPDFKEGFVVKGSDSAEFLRETLSQMGLTPKEYNEFIVYWAPKLQENEYNKIYFAEDDYTDEAKLEINPKPDSILRVFMVYEKADENTILPKQEIKPFERKGFTVVEWGGYLAE